MNFWVKGCGAVDARFVPLPEVEREATVDATTTPNHVRSRGHCVDLPQSQPFTEQTGNGERLRTPFKSTARREVALPSREENVTVALASRDTCRRRTSRAIHEHE